MVARDRSSRLSLALALALAFVATSALAHKKPDPRDIVFPQGQYIGNIDSSKLNEPSGIVYHSSRKTLFAVGDEGDICELTCDGRPVKQKHLRDGDFEGITHNPSTGLLYVAVEGEERILEVEPESFTVVREFAVDRTFRGIQLLKPSGNGFEAITFVPDQRHPEGGTFYLANQGFTFELDKDPSIIVEVVVPIKTGGKNAGVAKIIRAFSIRIVDLSDMHYDTATGHLWVISDATNTFFEITRQGEVLRGYALPGNDQEGFTMDPEGFVYIAQDSGGIIKFKWNKGR